MMSGSCSCLASSNSRRALVFSTRLLRGRAVRCERKRGEATATRTSMTVHAALDTGVRAAAHAAVRLGAARDERRFTARAAPWQLDTEAQHLFEAAPALSATACAHWHVAAQRVCP